MTSTYGLIGYPLTHSFSPRYFNDKFAREGISAIYNPYPIIDINELPELIKNYPDLRGLNVTIPYKERIIPFLDELDEVAKDVGAVNCITINNSVLKGYNTDVTGFEQSLVRLLQPQHTHALILGTGGASLAVAFVLKRLGISYQKVSREPGRGQLAYDALTDEDVALHTLIINTTPLGMHPAVDSAPAIPYHAISSKHLLYDLIYNPEVTSFLSLGKQKGAVTKNGYEMLVLQAEASWYIWNGLP